MYLNSALFHHGSDSGLLYSSSSEANMDLFSFNLFHDGLYAHFLKPCTPYPNKKDVSGFGIITFITISSSSFNLSKQQLITMHITRCRAITRRCTFRQVSNFTTASCCFSATARLSCIGLHQRPFKCLNYTKYADFHAVIVTLVLSRTVSEIPVGLLQVFVLLTPPLFYPNFGVFPLHRIAHVGVSERMGLKLFGREIIFEEFQLTHM